MNDAGLEARRAVESLRIGVPTRALVEFLGCDQDAITVRFDETLSKLPGLLSQGIPSPGFLIRGHSGLVNLTS